MTKIKIGQIGICHEHAGAKMESLRRLGQLFEVVGVVDDRATASPRFAGDDLRPYQGLPWMSEAELLNFPGLQAVLVETPNDDLVPTALRCMRRNLPMHLDKPGSQDAAGFLQLLAGCRERALPLQMGYMFRTNRALQFCRQAIEANWLGEVFEIQSSMSHDYGGPGYQEYLGQFPGGIMFNLGCHLLDFVVGLLGPPEAVSPFLNAAPGYPPAVKNNCLCVLEYRHALVTLRACSMEVDGLARRNLKICGTRGTLELCPLERFDGQPLQLKLTLCEGNDHYAAGVHWVDCGITLDRYEGQLTELAAVVTGRQPVPWSYEHDALVHKTVLAAAGYTAWEK